MAKEKLSVKELAEYLQLPVETVYKYVRAGKLPADKEGKHWVFTRSVIDSWMLENQNVAKSPLSKRVLVVEDEDPARKLMQRWLKAADYDVVTAKDGVAGESCLKKEEFDLVMTDLRMPRMDGAELLRRIQTMADKPSVVVVTAYYDGELMQKVMTLGTFRLIKKPTTRTAVLAVIESVIG